MENTVETKTIESNSTEATVVEVTNEITLEAPIFLLFVEYLGFITPLIDWAEEWCNDPKFPTWKKNILIKDAIYLQKRVKAAFTNEEIRKEYDIFYDIAIKAWSDLLTKQTSTK